jgi:hypothetical protein
MTEREAEAIEQLADQAEKQITSNYTKRDLKETRGMTKMSLYDGSKKLKHTIPKGKKI